MCKYPDRLSATRDPGTVLPDPIHNRSLVLVVFSVALVLTVLGGSACAATVVRQYVAPSVELSRLAGQPAVLLHVPRVETRYRDNTGQRPDSVLSDSFLVEAAQGLLLFETSKLFTLAGATELAMSLNPVTAPPQYSCLDSFLVDSARSAEVVRNAALSAGAAYVISPLSCSINYIANRPAGWRDDKYGPSYARPVTYTAFTTIAVQVWDSSGALLLERSVKTSANRSLLYGLFARKRKKETDIVNMASRFYASPIVKSMYQSAETAFSLADMELRMERKASVGRRRY